MEILGRVRVPALTHQVNTDLGPVMLEGQDFPA